MADNDDIERILREIDAMDGKKPPPPAKKPKGEVAPTDDSGGGSRLTWALMTAAGGGVFGLIIGTILGFLPWVSTFSTGVGAAIGGAAVGLVSGPPTWYRK